MRHALFISHGSPALMLSQHQARDFLAALGTHLPRPAGALVISAHFETPGLVLGAAEHPETLHDFFGFPETLYRVRYSAPGMSQAAQRLSDYLAERGHRAELDRSRPLDHGIWSPLSLLWPDANVPLLPVSVPVAATSKEQLALASELGAFAEQEDLWLIGSGAATHNLGDRKPEYSAPDEWAVAFNDWARDVASRGDLAALVDWQRQAPHARHAHPTPEHFLPLLMSVGALRGEPMHALHESFSFGNLSMLTLASPTLAAHWQTAA